MGDGDGSGLIRRRGLCQLGAPVGEEQARKMGGRLAQPAGINELSYRD
jgi:hypothetical protein